MGAAFAGIVVAAAGPARADDTIKRPADHPHYSAEIEPHALLGWYAPQYANSNSGFGLGGRVSIPVVDNGFVSTINNSVAISFGLDWIHYGGCWYNGNCSTDAFHIPVVMQWNFFVARHWSVFGEPGIEIYHYFFNDCPFTSPNTPYCGTQPGATGVWPTIYVGGRYHFNDNTALTMRLGLPSFSIGVSFFP